MAFRGTVSAGNKVYWTTNLPSSISFTVCGWFRPVTTTHFGTIASLESAGGTSYLKMWYDQSAGAVTTMSSGGGNTTVGNMSSNTDYFIAMTCAGTAGGDFKAYFGR